MRVCGMYIAVVRQLPQKKQSRKVGLTTTGMPANKSESSPALGLQGAL